MAKLDLSRIRKKYDYTAGEYRKLIKRITVMNTASIHKKAARLSDKNIKSANKKLSKKGFKKLVIPKGVEIPEDLMVKKATAHGDLISNELHGRLSKKLRRVMREFTPMTKEPKYVRRRGAQAGTVNPNLVDQLTAEFTSTFKNYTKKDKRYGVPSNVHGIAVTELRSAVSEMKSVYMEQFMQDNPNVDVVKQWVHNRTLSKEPRPHHMSANGKKVKASQPFILKNGAVLMYPHDPNAPAEEVINCNCDYLVFARVKK